MPGFFSRLPLRLCMGSLDTVDLDPLNASAITATISAILGGAAGEAGRNAWESLATLVRRAFGRGSPPDDIVDHAPSDEEVEALARELAARARTDPGFGEALRSWASHMSPPPSDNDRVLNMITGDAYVEGNVVQARDVAGSIVFGTPERRAD
ncbi:hypothetical protein FDG2_6051 [Candidatus Protofrankia californiensis]|uniref:Uncharacterized protein n=1 Tax=Candidatus Protofrankia californiensis TaxID=1839754 RepID=A0A1C3PGR3_9ACTN|nr:hypothetical protein FDG2_6051 [Candidatus Protofrankia californiensis]